MSVITVLLMFLTIGFASAALGRRFRVYSIATIVVFIVFGILTFIEGPNVGNNFTTPLIGLWERINIAAFMLWLLVFALALLRKKKYLFSRPDLFSRPGVKVRIDQSPVQAAEKIETIHKPEWLL